MTQPDYVPIGAAERVREVERLPAARHWFAERPAEIRGRAPHGERLGNPGPDIGYGLKLAGSFVPRLQLQPGEQARDAVAGCFAVGAARAALFGRAPVIYDMELAYRLFGFLGGAPADLVSFRVALFDGASHHYWGQRKIVDRVLESTLRLTPGDVGGRLGEWKALIQSS